MGPLGRTILITALVMAAGCGRSHPTLTASDHRAIDQLVKLETGETSYRLIENAPCFRSCRRQAGDLDETFANPLDSCGFVAVVGEGNSQTILQLERSWRGWATCDRKSRDPGEAPGLDEPFPLQTRP